MMSRKESCFTVHWFYYPMFLIIFSLSSSLVHGQRPPRPITVNKTVDLAFGAFYQGATGGNVYVSASNIRTADGGVVLLGMGYTVAPAVFSVSGNPGTLVTVLLGPAVLLNGSNGGSMTLTLDSNTSPVSPFVLTGGSPATKDLTVGGKLTVGSPASNPPGSYSGTFTIIFNQN